MRWRTRRRRAAYAWLRGRRNGEQVSAAALLSALGLGDEHRRTAQRWIRSWRQAQKEGMPPPEPRRPGKPRKNAIPITVNRKTRPTGIVDGIDALLRESSFWMTMALQRLPRSAFKQRLDAYQPSKLSRMLCRWDHCGQYPAFAVLRIEGACQASPASIFAGPRQAVRVIDRTDRMLERAWQHVERHSSRISGGIARLRREADRLRGRAAVLRRRSMAYPSGADQARWLSGSGVWALAHIEIGRR